MKKKRRIKDLLQSVPFMLPSFAGMIVFSLLPILISIIISLTDWNGLDALNWKTLSGHFIGLDNYMKILTTAEFCKNGQRIFYSNWCCFKFTFRRVVYSGSFSGHLQHH